MVDDFDIALFMSAYVEFHTEDPGDGSYIPMTAEEAQSKFLSFINNLQAEAWDEGWGVGGDYIMTLEVGNPEDAIHHGPQTNPYLEK